MLRLKSLEKGIKPFVHLVSVLKIGCLGRVLRNQEIRDQLTRTRVYTPPSTHTLQTSTRKIKKFLGF